MVDGLDEGVTEGAAMFPTMRSRRNRLFVARDPRKVNAEGQSESKCRIRGRFFARFVQHDVTANSVVNTNRAKCVGIG